MRQMSHLIKLELYILEIGYLGAASMEWAELRDTSYMPRYKCTPYVSILLDLKCVIDFYVPSKDSTI